MANEITIRFFGMVAEKLGRDTDVWSVVIDKHTSCKELINEAYPEISGMDFQIAVDQEICEQLPKNKSINEIAVLPPFAGG